jgi:hypothetical protein
MAVVRGVGMKGAGPARKRLTSSGTSKLVWPATPSTGVLGPVDEVVEGAPAPPALEPPRPGQ